MLIKKTSSVNEIAGSIYKDLLINKDDNDGLNLIIGKIESAIDNLTRFEFDTVVEKIESYASEEKIDKNIINRFLKITELISQTLLINDNGDIKKGSVISIPLILKSNVEAQFKRITPIVGNKIEVLFKKYKLIESESSVEFLPRILSANEAHSIGYHEIRRINYLMAIGDLRSAMQVVVQARLKSGLGFPSSEKQSDITHASAGVMVIYAENANATPFNILNEVNGKKLLSPTCISIPTQIRMQEIKYELQKILSVEDLDIKNHIWDWFMPLYDLCIEDRSINSNNFYQGVVDSSGAENKDKLFISSSIIMNESPRSFQLVFKNKGSRIKNSKHELIWNLIKGESVEECVSSIETFIKSIKIEIEN